MSEPLKIAICVPVRGEVKAGFAFDLCHMIGHFGVKETREGHSLYTDYVEGTLICNQRQQMVDRAMRDGATHTLWLDSDMRFPPDVIRRLVDRDKDVVCANYATRRSPIVPICIKLSDAGEPEHTYTHPESTGVEKVFSAGMGCMLVKTEVYRRLEYPTFMIPWVEMDHAYVGEDIYFCRQLAAKGVEIWVDHDLSKQVAHTGDMEFNVAHTIQAREIRKAHSVKAEEFEVPKGALSFEERVPYAQGPVNGRRNNPPGSRGDLHSGDGRLQEGAIGAGRGSDRDVGGGEIYHPGGA